MKEFFVKMFSDESGNPSSNRVIGSLVILVALILVCVGQKDQAVVAFTSGTALLGVGQVKSAAILAAQASASKPVEAKPEEKAKADPAEASEKK